MKYRSESSRILLLSLQLLDQASSVTSDLMTKAMTLLAPYQRQLGSVFQQVQALAAPFHLANA